VAEIDPIFISVKGAAEVLDTTPWSVYKLLDAGVIESQYMGTRRKVVVESLRQYAGQPPQILTPDD
jgi:hypothetical protein